MALITCKECGGKVSDKATICPHCGCPIIKAQPQKIICKECDAEIPKGIKICPECGCPVTTGDKASSPSALIESSVSEEQEEELQSKPVGGDGSEIPNRLNKFNWGAFGAWPFWGFVNGMPWLLFVAIGVAIACLCINLVVFSDGSIYDPLSYLITGSVFTIVCIIFGSIGSRKAWSQKQWDSEDDFVRSQREWMGWGIVCYVLFAIAIIVSMTLNPIKGLADGGAADSTMVDSASIANDNLNDNPEESLVESTARSNANGFDYDGGSVQFIPGRYTGTHDFERLALCPMKKTDEETGETLNSKCVILFYKDADKWTVSCVVGMATDARVQDVDNDSLLEVICTNEQNAGGEKWRGVTVYKLKDNNVVAIYDTPGLAKNWNCSVVNLSEEDLSAGQEVSRVADVDFNDENGDGIQEIKETITTKVVKSVTSTDSIASEPQYAEKTKTRTLRLRGGRYR